MGRIAEALRENLRQLAQADARILRELDGALPSMSQPEPQVAGELAEGLEKLGVKELKALCKERGFKGCSGLNKAALIQRLRGGGRTPAGRKGSGEGSGRALWPSRALWPGRDPGQAGSHGDPAAADRREGGGERFWSRLRPVGHHHKGAAIFDSSCTGG
jgi:hypothetical protein